MPQNCQNKFSQNIAQIRQQVKICLGDVSYPWKSPTARDGNFLLLRCPCLGDQKSPLHLNLSISGKLPTGWTGSASGMPFAQKAFHRNWWLLIQWHVMTKYVTCYIEVKPQKKIKSKAEFGRVVSCQRYFFFSLSVTLFMLVWLEDVNLPQIPRLCSWHLFAL